MRGIPIHRWLVPLLCLTLAEPATAESVQSRREMFERATAHLQREQWPEARALLLALWQQRKTYDVALQLGQVEYNLDQIRDAAEHLAYGLATLPPREHLKTADRSKQILALCRERLGSLDLQIGTQGADVLVDGKAVGAAPLLTELYLEPGHHRFEVRSAAHHPQTWEMQFAPGSTQARIVELRPLLDPPNHAGQDKPAATTSTPRAGPRGASVVPLIAGGVVTLAGVATGISMQFLRKSREDEANSIRSQFGPSGCLAPSLEQKADCDRLLTLSADYDSYGQIELISFLIGGAALLGTGAYFFVARPDHAPTGVTRPPMPVVLNASLSRHRSQLDLTVPF